MKKKLKWFIYPSLILTAVIFFYTTDYLHNIVAVTPTDAPSYNLLYVLLHISFLIFLPSAIISFIMTCVFLVAGYITLNNYEAKDMV